MLQAMFTGEWNGSLPTARLTQDGIVQFNIHFIRLYVSLQNMLQDENMQIYQEKIEAVIAQVEKDLIEAIAEELFHLYVLRKYPRAQLKTLIANAFGGEFYKKDKGETSAKLFAKKYQAFL